MEPIAATSAPKIRLAVPDDLPALQALLERSSPDTRFRRFHGAGGVIERHEMARIATPTELHRSWVAVDGPHVRGTATLAWGSDGRAEAAFWVEDAWFRRGIGRSLFAALGEQARRCGLTEVVAWVQVDNRPARQFLRSMAPSAASAFAGGGELEISVPIPPSGPVLPAPPFPTPSLVSPARSHLEIA